MTKNLNNTTSTELTLPQAVAQLRLIDDEMMRTALQDQIDLVQFILRIIMHMPGLIVTRMELQKDLLQIGGGRSLTLDVWAVDSDGTQYNIEIQRATDGAEPHRPRYHLSLLDAACLRRGSGFDKLPNTKVIFITERDCIGSGELLERFVFRNAQGHELQTGQEIIYLNTAFTGRVKPGDEDRAALAHDFKCADPADMQLKPLADRMRFLKDTREGRTQMSSVIEQYVKQESAKAAAKAAAEATAKTEAAAEERDLSRARTLYATGKHDIDELAKLFDLDAAQILGA